MEIRLETCTIRSWRKDDVDSIVRLANNRAVARNLRDRFPHPYRRKDAKAWIRNARAAKPECMFAIDVEGRAVGGIGLHPQEHARMTKRRIDLARTVAGDLNGFHTEHLRRREGVG